MKGDLIQKSKAYKGVRDVLRKPEHEALWLDNPPYLTELVGQFETKAKELGAFGEGQSQTLTGITAEQNDAEKSLEDAAYPLARALRLKLRADGNLSDAAVWDLQLTDWRRLQESVLLEKARALHGAALPLTQEQNGEPATGPKFGITAAKAQSLGDLIDDYDEVIGAPLAARGERKAKTTRLRPRFRVVDGILDDVDDLIVALRGESEAHDLFVDIYFNARRIGGHSSQGKATTPETPVTPAS